MALLNLSNIICPGFAPYKMTHAPTGSVETWTSKVSWHPSHRMFMEAESRFHQNILASYLVFCLVWPFSCFLSFAPMFHVCLVLNKGAVSNKKPFIFLIRHEEFSVFSPLVPFPLNTIDTCLGTSPPHLYWTVLSIHQKAPAVRLTWDCHLWHSTPSLLGKFISVKGSVPPVLGQEHFCKSDET